MRVVNLIKIHIKYPEDAWCWRYLLLTLLSEHLALTIHRDKKSTFMKFNNGVPEESLKEIGESEKSGTEITFLPSKTFSKTEFDFKNLRQDLGNWHFLILGKYLNHR